MLYPRSHWPLLAALLSGCGPLSPTAVTAIETVDATACTALSAVVSRIALACPGEESALAAVLALLERDGGTAQARTSGPTVAVTRRTAGGRRLVGYVAPEMAPAMQALLDGQ